MSDLINKKIVAAELAQLIYNGSDDETAMDKLAEQLSVSLKKKFLLGNIVISLLTAWVIFILFWFALQYVTVTAGPGVNINYTKLFRVTFLYAGFAFIISLIREVIKDMEDIEGDARFGCKTMPIVWGIPATKVFCGRVADRAYRCLVHCTILCAAIWLVGECGLLFFIDHTAAGVDIAKTIQGRIAKGLSHAKYHGKVGDLHRYTFHDFL